jgi:uncharacterized oligopeptide transporter (OPT) family protein
MSPGDISGKYVKYIGAGAVAAGGILSMLNALPLIFASIGGSLKALGGTRSQAVTGAIEEIGNGIPRTDRDIPMPFVLLGSIGLVAAIAASNLIPTDLTGRIIGGVLVVLFGFLFVTVSSRITGVIGSSSNPISGMTIATLLLTCLIFVVLGWVGPEYRLVALSIAGVVCIASSNGGTTSQDLKTGYLVGATPWKQQVSILVGALVSAIVMGGTLLWLNDAYSTTTNKAGDLPSVKAEVAKLTETDIGEDGKTYKVWWVVNPQEGVLPGKYLVDENGQAVYLKDPGIGGRLTYSTSGAPLKKFDPPQPRLFATIIDGIMKGDLPWGLVILGAVLAVVMQLAGVSALAFAVGVYLPLSTTLPIFVGGLIRAIVDRARRFTPEESETSPGTMMSTGLIAGGSLAGIIIALLVVFENLGKALDFSRFVGSESMLRHYSVAAFAVLTLALFAVAMIGKRQAGDESKELPSSTELE